MNNGKPLGTGCCDWWCPRSRDMVNRDTPKLILAKIIHVLESSTHNGKNIRNVNKY